MSEMHEALQSETGFTRCNRVLSMFYVENCLLGPGKMVEFAVRSRSNLMSEPSSCLIFNTCYIGIKLELCSLLEFPVFFSFPSSEFPVIDCISVLIFDFIAHPDRRLDLCSSPLLPFAKSSSVKTEIGFLSLAK